MNATEAESSDQRNDDIDQEIPGILHAVAVGCAIGAVSVFIAVAGAVYLSQHNLAGALALGGMSAFWGGLGFGAMFGGTLHVVWHSDEGYSSTKVVAAQTTTRTLGIVEVPSAGKTHVAEGTASGDPRAVRDSSQVA